jgi:hypothetical protein
MAVATTIRTATPMTAGWSQAGRGALADTGRGAGRAGSGSGGVRTALGAAAGVGASVGAANDARRIMPLSEAASSSSGPPRSWSARERSADIAAAVG